MSLRDDIVTASATARKRNKKKKKKMKTAGLFSDIYDYATGKKKKRSSTIDDILEQAPDRPEQQEAES